VVTRPAESSNDMSAVFGDEEEAAAAATLLHNRRRLVHSVLTELGHSPVRSHDRFYSAT
jgi:hypothetical protein